MFYDEDDDYSGDENLGSPIYFESNCLDFQV